MFRFNQLSRELCSFVTGSYDTTLLQPRNRKSVDREEICRNSVQIYFEYHPEKRDPFQAVQNRSENRTQWTALLNR